MIDLKVLGDKEVLALLRDLPPKVRTRIVRKAIRFAAIPAIDAARVLAPVDTGALKASIDVRFIARRRGEWAAAAIGPRAMKGMFIISRAGKLRRVRKLSAARLAAGGAERGARLLARNPRNYAHLVEFGHAIVAGGRLARPGRKAPKQLGKAIGRVAARPFMRPALDATEDGILALARLRIRQGVEALAKQALRRR